MSLQTHFALFCPIPAMMGHSINRIYQSLLLQFQLKAPFLDMALLLNDSYRSRMLLTSTFFVFILTATHSAVNRHFNKA